jgi:hypothetical protein
VIAVDTNVLVMLIGIVLCASGVNKYLAEGNLPSLFYFAWENLTSCDHPRILTSICAGGSVLGIGRIVWVAQVFPEPVPELFRTICVAADAGKSCI